MTRHAETTYARAIVASLAASGHQRRLGYLQSFDANIARLENG